MTFEYGRKECTRKGASFRSSRRIAFQRFANRRARAGEKPIGPDAVPGGPTSERGIPAAA